MTASGPDPAEGPEGPGGPGEAPPGTEPSGPVGADERKGIGRAPDEVDKPSPVADAEERIRVWGIGLGTAGAVGSALYWFTAMQTGYLFVPLSWWLLFLIGLVALFFFPPVRGPRVAREILERWDELAVDAAMEAAGSPTGPGQRVASEMAARILHHPRADAAVKDVVRRLLEAVRRVGRDRRTVELVQQARAAGLLTRPGERSWSDLLDFVSAREGELISSLERLHRAVVQRELGEVADLRVDAENVLARVEAEVEVDRMLQGDDPE